jgi:hypothetical protein
MFARAAHTTFDGEFETAYEMANRLMKKYNVTEWDVCYRDLLFYGNTDRDYVLRNFQTAKTRWDEMDREKARQEAKTKTTQTSTEKTEKKEAEPGYRLVWVNGHSRTSKKGTVYQVAGHYRKVKIRTKA